MCDWKEKKIFVHKRKVGLLQKGQRKKQKGSTPGFAQGASAKVSLSLGKPLLDPNPLV